MLVVLIAALGGCDTGNSIGQACLTTPDCNSNLLCCGLPSGSTCQAPVDGGCVP